MKSKFGKGKNLLYGYIKLPEDDPVISEFTYGEGPGRKGGIVRSGLGIGNYVFFHTTIGGQRYITAYYVVSKIMEGFDARRDENIRKNYKNPHLHDPGWIEGEYEDVIIFGDPKKSGDLRDNPLPFDRNLAERLEFEGLGITFDVVDKNGKIMKDSKRISDCTRSPRYITDKDVEFLLSEISTATQLSESLAEEALDPEEIGETLDIDLSEFAEKDIEDLIHSNPSCLDEGLEILERQHAVPSGRIDLLAQDKDGSLIVVEIKKDTPRDDVLAQLLSYMKYIKKDHPAKRVNGAIVCKDCSKRLYDAAEDAGIRIYYYGAKFGCDRVI